jgi:Tfp pilus assembly protein PilW
MRRRSARRPARRGPAGFTLIEILVALFIFMTGVLGVLALMTTGLALHRDGLQLARATRQLDGAGATLLRELAAGGHRGAGGERVDVAPRRLPDGTWLSVRFHDAHGDEPAVAELRLAGTAAGLASATPVRLVLPDGPPPAAEVARLRAARGRATEGGNH